MIKKWIFGTSVVGGMAALVLGLTLVFTGSLATENPDDTTKLASALTTSGNGTSEGIQVHGDWTIEVHDPDGTLVEKREFKNAFKGASHMEAILTREKRPHLWAILFVRNIYDLENGIFTIQEPTGGGSYGEDGAPGSSNLTVSGGGDGTVIMQSEFTVSEKVSTTGVFSGEGATEVYTMLQMCNIGSNACGGFYTSFTEKVLQKPITAKEGQKVNVTVQISFD